METMTGSERPVSRNSPWMAKSAALALSVSNTRLDQQEIGPAIHKAPHLLAVGRLQFLEGSVAEGRIRDIRR